MVCGGFTRSSMCCNESEKQTNIGFGFTAAIRNPTSFPGSLFLLSPGARERGREKEIPRERGC